MKIEMKLALEQKYRLALERECRLQREHGLTTVQREIKLLREMNKKLYCMLYERIAIKWKYTIITMHKIQNNCLWQLWRPWLWRTCTLCTWHQPLQILSQSVCIVLAFMNINGCLVPWTMYGAVDTKKHCSHTIVTHYTHKHHIPLYPVCACRHTHNHAFECWVVYWRVIHNVR